MLVDAPYVALIIVVTLDLVSSAYVIFAMWRVGEFGRRSEGPETSQRPVTVLIPICGLDVGLYENLRSICCQAYPDYQLVVGVQNTDDPALDVVRRIIGEFPDRDIALVIEDRIAGPNLKISNLSNMYPRAKHTIVVILDSDMRVNPDYLATIVAPFQDPAVGVVTCLYKGTPAGGLPSVLGSMFINEWFLPSVLVALSLGKLCYCFGATMAVRRDVFDKIGGFSRLGSYLADDYMLGKLITQEGYRVHLSSYVVENVVIEHSFKSLFLHELRWARTIRTVQPIGYAFSFITYTIPLAIVAGLVDEFTTDTDYLEWGLIGFAILLRVALHFIARSVLQVRHGPSPWLVPIRDMLSFVVWAIGLFGRDIVWRGQAFSVNDEGHLVAKDFCPDVENAVSQSPVV